MKPGAIATDPAAFEDFYRQHLDVVHRFVARRVGDPHLALDLTADIFLAAIDAAATFDPTRGSVTGWLYGISRHVVAAEHRRRGREQGAVSRLGARRPVEADAMAAVADRLAAAADARRVYAAMADLPEDQRAVLELVSLDGLSLVDCARVLGVTAVTARVRLHRARRAVLARLSSSRSAPTSSEVLL